MDDVAWRRREQESTLQRQRCAQAGRRKSHKQDIVSAAPGCDMHCHASPAVSETAKKFTIQFTDATTNGRYTATFGGAGLRIVAPSVTAPCHPATNNPWDY
jgi:hypothetical protein